MVTKSPRIYYDVSTGIPITETYKHYLIHEEKLFHASAYFQTVANASVAELIISPSSTKETNISFSIEAGGACKIELLKNVTTTADGTTATVQNLDLDSSNSNTTGFFYSPTGATGTVFSETYLPGGTSAPTRAGGFSDTELEWHFPKGSKNMLRITNVSGSTITVSVSADFDEEVFD